MFARGRHPQDKCVSVDHLHHSCHKLLLAERHEHLCGLVLLGGEGGACITSAGPHGLHGGGGGGSWPTFHILKRFSLASFSATRSTSRPEVRRRMDQSTHRASPSLTSRSAMLPFCRDKRGVCQAHLCMRGWPLLWASPGAAQSPLHSVRTRPPVAL